MEKYFYCPKHGRVTQKQAAKNTTCPQCRSYALTKVTAKRRGES